MPDAIRALADFEHNRVVFCVVDYGQRIVLIGAEPRLSAVESAANVADVVIEDHVFAIHPAGELRPGNFYFRGLIIWNAGVGDCDSPQQGGFEIAGRGNRVHIAGFVADLRGDARIVGNGEAKRT